MNSPKFQSLLEHFPDYISSVLQKDAKNNNFYQCPFCGSGTHGTHSTGALAVDFTKKTWFCHACGENGGMLDLCMKLEHLASRKEAFMRLCDEYFRDNKIGHTSPAPSPDPDDKDTKTMSDAETKTVDYTKYFRTCRRNMDKGGYRYLASRGIPARLADSFGIGFDPRWEHPKNASNDKHYYTPRLIIPLGKHAYLARDTRKKQKKQFSKLKCGHLQDYFFGQKAIENPFCFFVVEGEFDCLSLYTVGAPAVALGSIARINRFMEKLVKKKPKGLCLIALDNDEAGKTAARKLAEECKKHGIRYRVVHSLSGSYKDPNEYLMKSPDEFKQKMQQFLCKVHKGAAVLRSG